MNAIKRLTTTVIALAVSTLFFGCQTKLSDDTSPFEPIPGVDTPKEAPASPKKALEEPATDTAQAEPANTEPASGDVETNVPEEKEEPIAPAQPAERVFTISAELNNAMISDGLTPAPKHAKLKITKKKSTDWINPQVWLQEHQFTAPELPYNDGTYAISGTAIGTSYPYHFNHLILDDDRHVVTKFDFSAFYHQAEAQGYSQFAKTFIHYAIVQDGIVYVSLSHNTYSRDNPIEAFILALDINDGKIIWRSPNLVSNANNFVIVDDTIITGYGFTDEKDYLYTLDRNTGAIVDKLALKSGPNYIVRDGDKLHVLTYNTDYELSIQ